MTLKRMIQLSSAPRLPHFIVVILLACLLILPALYLGLFELVSFLLLGVSFALLIFSRPLYALLAYIVFIPLEELIVLPTIGTLTRLAAILFFATYLFHRRFRLHLNVIPRVGWLWLVWAFASLLWSVQPEVQSYFQHVQLFLITLMLADYIARQPQHLRIILNWYTTSALGVASFGIFNFFQGVSMEGTLTGNNRTSAIEGQGVENFAFYLVPAFFVVFQNLLTAKTFTRRVWFTVLLAIFSTALILSGTRGSWTSVLGGLLFIYLPRLKLRQLLSLFIVTALIATALVRVPVIADFLQFRAGNALESGGAGRLDIWKTGTLIVLNHPIIGVGFENFVYHMDFALFEKTPFDISLSQPFFNRVPHNIYLQMLADLGIIGFVLWLLWLFYLLRVRPKNNDWLLVWGILVAMLVSGMTNPSLNRKYFWLPVALAHGLIYTQVSKREEPTSLPALSYGTIKR